MIEVNSLLYGSVDLNRVSIEENNVEWPCDFSISAKAFADFSATAFAKINVPTHDFHYWISTVSVVKSMAFRSIKKNEGIPMVLDGRYGIVR